ncbi:hypothetical protein LWP59_38790 [Amycolatopsis acidiphila]|uniref:Uncharacterized protein n=1 Tax=Amycolatopsis acidiphila TaxID=715473 RepID=A0A557ZZG8_9PSEU|nr:hypothetical protein [Amycolatopsis acidiphila]TVT17394.1 hypothetical protein FNH06_31715 [Amycolatopsis acidiphila]UIJ59862.1 hypothetical protein LWP59_38790 [Amycolatopsis acidiphila]GHG62749.1 hypothetical protein GCM10017788_18620 [Amycolatopsis acidiphila]
MSPAISWVSTLLALLLILNVASNLDLHKLARKAAKRMKKIIEKYVALVPAAMKVGVLHLLMAASS